MNRVCIYHAGCPDGFGAAWSVWRAWGDSARYIARSHDQPIQPDAHVGAWVAYVDIAPSNEELSALADVAERVTVLDHHVTARDRYESDFGLVNRMDADGHEILYDLGHSGSILAWNYFSEGAPAPDLLRYVEDQDLWNWKLPGSQEVNAAIGAYPYDFELWSTLASRPIQDLANEGVAIVRANDIEVQRGLRRAHTITIDGEKVEAVNSAHVRSMLGHELAERRLYGVARSCVYRLGGDGDQVNATLYSVGDVDVGSLARSLGGGGHKNAAGFTVSLARWLTEFLA